jgi:hypothetical protein
MWFHALLRSRVIGGKDRILKCADYVAALLKLNYNEVV